MANNNNTRRAKRTAELFQNVLGLTGESGYTNAFRVGKQLSKRSSKNYFTNTRSHLNKPIINRKKHLAKLLPRYDADHHGSRLHYAIKLGQPEAIKLLYNETVNTNERNPEGLTLWEALIKSYFDLYYASRDRRISLNQRRQKERAAQSLLEFLPTLMARNPTITFDGVEQIWLKSLNELDLRRFLNFRPIVEFSVENFVEIEASLEAEIMEIMNEFNNNEPNPNILEQIRILEQRISQLNRLVNTFDPDTGMFFLQPQPQVFVPIFPAPPAAPAAPAPAAPAAVPNIIAQLQALGLWNPNA